MKKFIKYIIGIILGIIVILVLVDIAYTYVYINAKPRNKTQYILQLKNKKIDYVFLGSSRVDNHIVTKLVEKKTSGTAINLGIQGGKLDVTYLILQLLLENNIQFKKLFIQVDYNFNFDNSSGAFNAETMPYIRCNDLVNKFHKKYNPDYLRCYYIPFYRYATNDFKIGFREFFSSLINKIPDENFSDGFEPLKGSYSDTGFVLPKKIHDKNLIFNKINNLCKQRHIDVVYFCAPFCPKLKQSNFTEQLQKKIPSLKNYSNFLNDEKYFCNDLHMNELGANKFTRMLIDDCILKK